MNERRVIVNISGRAAGKGLRETLEDEATSWGRNVRPFVGQIYEYALQNKSSFVGRLREARPKGGREIAGSVSRETASRLTKWAKIRKTLRGHHCCYVLEKALEDKLIPKIFGSSSAHS